MKISFQNIKRFACTCFILSFLALGIEVFAQSPKQPEIVFEEDCSGCHTGGFKGMLTGAPEIGESEEWQEFFETGLETMSRNVYTGEKKHEVKGDCEDCTQEDITATVQYIMDKTK